MGRSFHARGAGVSENGDLGAARATFQGMARTAEDIIRDVCELAAEERARVGGFPYSVLFVVDECSEVEVTSVAHAKREPGFWRSRM